MWWGEPGSCYHRQHMSQRARAFVALSLAIAACNSPAKKSENEKNKTAATAEKLDAKKDAAAAPVGPPQIPAPADVAAAPADAQKSASGLASKVVTPGKGGEHPRAWDEVTVNYTGWTTDGKMFDSSLVARVPGQPPVPATFALNGVIPGWTEGVQLMTEGEKRRFWIPEELAYKGQMGAPQGTLVFDVELLSVEAHARPTRRARRRCCGARGRAEDRQRSAVEGAQQGHGQEPPQAHRHRQGALHGLDDRRQDVRQLGHAR